MEHLFGLVEAFYSRFLLRDFLAKILPGILVMVFILYRLGVDLLGVEISFFVGVCIAALAWIVGFAVQGLGEILCLIEYHQDNEAADRYLEFIRYDGDKKVNEKDIERIVVIKETCGNMQVASILILITLIIDYFIMYLRGEWIIASMNYHYALTYILIISLIGSLRYMHLSHVYRQDMAICKMLGLDYKKIKQDIWCVKLYKKYIRKA